MQYTLWSLGRLIGETDLGFAHMGNCFRMGWFQPSADGEALMPRLAPQLPWVREYHERKATGIDERKRDPRSRAAAMIADYAEMEQHQAAFALELRRADGSIVRTTYISIRDGRQFLDIDFDDLHEGDDAELTPELQEAVDADYREWLSSRDGVTFDDDWADESMDVEPWTRDDVEPSPGQDFQISVELATPHEIP